MSRTVLVFAMAGLGSLFATGLHGQVPTRLTPGQTVRITDETGRHRTGEILSISTDHGTIEIKDRLGRWTYDLDDLSTIEEKAGSYTSARTILITMGVTALAGGLLGTIAGVSCDGEFLCPGPAGGLAAGVLGGAALGLPFGLVLWPIIRYSRWERVGKPESHPRLGLGLSVKIPLPSW
ncbi:MAG: hypothetical protein P8099_07485 [Gemmatimonadota bacterium]|jgi:hypothetical protein